MEVSQELYDKAFAKTTTWYKRDDNEDDPEMWESFSVLNDDATEEQKSAYVECYIDILGQGDDARGAAELKKKIKECAKGIKDGSWIDEDQYNAIWQKWSDSQ